MDSHPSSTNILSFVLNELIRLINLIRFSSLCPLLLNIKFTGFFLIVLLFIRLSFCSLSPFSKLKISEVRYQVFPLYYVPVTNILMFLKFNEWVNEWKKWNTFYPDNGCSSFHSAFLGKSSLSLVPSTEIYMKQQNCVSYSLLYNNGIQSSVWQIPQSQ